ncbi:hypothetical protein GOP47_0016136 [Adiantum capillus-veneris]|uniref:N-acetyltransferase domain-containing protein n=1 Tax=Adiantum capillus-veneris TaxID=13818 RepID=A0A9D4UKN9_ADICA|nr:hypothetical protein GOP47_0015798 [Adiantum capillus-veneris]KAI5069835.1 hypothetical protein GOP47_0016136 [Adiantum capillus-veneris]
MALSGGLLPQTSISLNKDAVDVVQLSALLAATRQNCLQFPLLQPDGSLAEAAHPSKLRLALHYSTLVVSIHMRGPIPGGDYMHTTDRKHQQQRTPFLNFSLGQSRPVPRLIAFGRATSDHALTASIHDLAVAPSLQRRGFGRRILQKLLRELGRRGITDIAALAAPEQRPFFTACGFGDDELNSTTMLYLRSSMTSREDSVKRFGRKSLVIPAALRAMYMPSSGQHDMERS